tara:strand:- start:1264 stop:1806 length:543 start_codon:yes stop_codon:yes gene_type:complete
MKLLHALAFQVVWFACVLGAAEGSSLPGLGAGAVFLALTLLSSREGWAELRFVAKVTLLGVGLDSLLGLGGALAFSAPVPGAPGVAPLWLAMLWASFATLAPRSLTWLQERLVLAAGLGVLAGPLTYLSATRLGAAEFSVPPALALCLVALEYGIALPLVLRASRSLSRAPEPVATSERT